MAVVWRLSLTPTISTWFVPFCSIVHAKDGTILIPVWSQFRISSAGISSIVTVAITSARNAFFSTAKSTGACLLLAVVAFLWTNFIHFNSTLAQCLLSCTCPPNSASYVLSQFSKMPLAAAIAILADTTPPSSLTFFRYFWAITSKLEPSKTGVPCFCECSAVLSPALGPPLLFRRTSSTYASLIDHTVVLLTVCFIFFEKSLAAAATPCCEAYLPIAAWSLAMVCTTFPPLPYCFRRCLHLLVHMSDCCCRYFGRKWALWVQ